MGGKRSEENKEAEKESRVLSRAFWSSIIVAGGSSTRMKEVGIAKQFCLVDGIPVVARSVNAMEECGFISEILIVAREEDLPIYEEYRIRFQWKKVRKIVIGGENRTESVRNGFVAIDEKSEYVLIHDAARCLITPDMIRNVCTDAVKHGASCAACKASDSIKKADHDMITEDIPRDSVWCAQTPQVFRTEVYRAAAYTALQNGYQATDDCALAGYIGFPVHLTDCGPENIKITHPQDLLIAEAILRYRKQTSKGNE